MIGAGIALPLAYSGMATASATSAAIPLINRISVEPSAGARADITTFTFPAADAASKPVLFVFPGGPGSAVADMIIGGLGPRVLAFPSPPTLLTDDVLIPNSHPLTHVCTMVFVDMPEVGFSRIHHGGVRAFFGIRQDAACQAAVVRNWLALHGRPGMPVVLAGKSYGTIRMAYTAARLAETAPDIALVGLISLCGAWDLQAMDFEAASIARGNMTAFWSFLPSFAAIAWHYGRIPREGTFDAFVAAAERFALDRYAPALLRGTRLPPADADRLANELAGWTGLPAVEIRARDCRITSEFFRTRLVPGKTLWLDNATFALDGETLDPHAAVTGRAWRSELARIGAQRPADYRMGSLGPAAAWDWSTQGDWNMGYPGAAEPVAAVMQARPLLRLFVATGYYDLETSFSLIENAVRQPAIPAARTTLNRYQSGHTTWVDPAERDALNADLTRWIAALPAASPAPRS